ncbi:PDDEXK nuclease domain-containing protein [Pasteurella skyensis]|uniref:PDDEXK nuclease domain-containing protein n=1 Tax=Phocoenobacter skyensis TaxID=97481 RepID=A0AAJ6P3D9_9PAST|nr:PDDEXK nuclease domain-containing protein [Pasteurella skyensis]MDP8171459.1 PDDEXK nuclease domain-containing protein [Pasteurella skyensis]MDP8175654.1 PDDEXK nuclease domain-containing protein [Pasteurella skyensis]
MDTKNNNVVNTQYKIWLQDLKQDFHKAQIKAHIKVNTTLLEFYWQMGKDIIQKQKDFAWGSGFLEQLSKDLSAEFPDVKGFSYRNLRAIKQWVEFWQQLVAKLDNEIGKQVVSQLTQIPWGHNIAIIQKCKNSDEALFYVTNTLENGISRAVLIHQIESNLYQRSGKAITNFDTTLPPIQSDLAKQITKDPYNFDFLTITDNYQEKELEAALCENITKFLLELGNGFAFVGKQYKLNVGGEDFRIDLLFYHLKLRCYVVIELKAVDFKPEFAGKLSFYTTAIDNELKTEQDNATIGILICKSKKDIVVEYALKDINKPLGVSKYDLIDVLPKDYQSAIPSIEQIEAELNQRYI